MDGKYEPNHLRQVKLSHEAQVERYVPALVSGCRLFRFHFGSSYSRLTPAVESDQLAPRPATQLWTMAPQLTTTEQSLIDDVVRKDGGTPMDAPPSQPAGTPAASQPARPPARLPARSSARQPGSRSLPVSLASPGRQEARQSQTARASPFPKVGRVEGVVPKMVHFQSLGVRQSTDKPDPDQ